MFGASRKLTLQMEREGEELIFFKVRAGCQDLDEVLIEELEMLEVRWGDLITTPGRADSQAS